MNIGNYCSLDNIEVNTPEDIYLENLSIEGGMLNLSGYSPNYEDIAKYIVKLNMDRVDNTTLPCYIRGK